MTSIGIGEIQKNTSIFSHLSEPLEIVDKRKKQKLAMVYPIKHHSKVDSLAGKYKDQVTKTDLSIEEIKEKALKEAFGEKYGLSS